MKATLSIIRTTEHQINEFLIYKALVSFSLLYEPSFIKLLGLNQKLWQFPHGDHCFDENTNFKVIIQNSEYHSSLGRKVRHIHLPWDNLNF